MDNQWLDYIVDVSLTVARMRVLVEGALILYDDESSLSPDNPLDRSKAEQALDAIGLALGDLRELICELQAGFARLPGTP